MQIFDKNLLKINRERAAKNFQHYDFLFEMSSEDIADRLTDMNRDFATALQLGCRGKIQDKITNKNIIHYIQTDIAKSLLDLAGNNKIIADSELLPFAENSFDLIISVLDLHSINDLPGALIQIKNCLKDKGIFIASMFGGETLTELRQIFIETEIQCNIGVSPHIAPFATIQDMAALMQRANFTMPVVDIDNYQVSYDNSKKLMRDLRGMAETNILIEKNNKYLGKKFFDKLDQNYFQKFTIDDQIMASYEIITITGSKN